MSKTKKSLLASAVSLIVCLALLTGTTFAWLSDRIVNTGNTIQAGELQFDVTGYRLKEGNWASYVIHQHLGEEPLIDAENWEPGQHGAIMLKIKNEGSVALQVSLSVQAEGELLGGLWYHIDTLTSDYGSGGDSMKSKLLFSDPDKRPANGTENATCMSGLADAAIPVLTIYPAAAEGDGEDTYAYYLLEYGMYTDAENTYQGKSVNLDIAVNATQACVETDGFGRADYDAEATFPVTDSGSLVTALERGGLVSAVSDFTWDEAVTMAGGTQSVLNLEQDAVITVTRGGIVDVNGQAQLTLQGMGRMEQDMNSELGFLVRASDDSKVVIREGTYISGLTCIQAGGNAQVEIYGGHFEALTDWNETYWLLNLIDNSNASITVYGGTFVNFDPSHSRTENPEANFVADGYKVVSETQANDDIWYTVVPE